MPSLTDLANQVNNTLTQIQTNTQDCATTVALVKGDTADIKTRLDTVIAGMDAGFANLSGGLYAILETGRETNAHLATQVNQNNTVICLLTTTNDLLCQLLRTQQKALAVARETRVDVGFLRSVTTLLHAREAVEVAQREELEARIEACCGEPPPKDEPCFRPCPTPEVRTYRPDGQEWKPLPARTPTRDGRKG